MNYQIDDHGYGTSPFILQKVFAFMSLAVLISGLSALFFAQNALLLTRSVFVLPLLLIAQLGLVITISWKISAFSFSTVQLLFFLYSALSGATLSVIFFIYTTASIIQVFFIASLMFFSMALYGYYTKVDLSSYRSLLMMALWGLVIAMFVNLIFNNRLVDFMTAAIGVLLFSALTAYDIQNIQKMSHMLLAEGEDWNKIALIGALQLYLDFINLFLSLLRLFGRRNNS